MAHIWLRAEQRANETRVGLTPQGAQMLRESGIDVSVEESSSRVIPDAEYAHAGCTMVASHTWPDAPKDAIIFGLKELPEDDTPLPHRHIMFGHAFKGQPAGQRLLQRFKAGGGTLLDLEYLTDETGRRLAAFGYWAGYAGAAVALKCWAAQQKGQVAGPIGAYNGVADLLAELRSDLSATGVHRPNALIVGALGRVGTGVSDLCEAIGVATTKWDIEETKTGGPFPQVLIHDLFFNCVLARPGTPVFVPADARTQPRQLSVIADIACDPDSDFSPIKVYDQTTTWLDPVLRVHDAPVLDVTAIDNLPSLLPLESSEDYAGQLLPVLAQLAKTNADVWLRAEATYREHLARL